MQGFEKRRAFIMSNPPEGTYWTTNENEYNIQIHCAQNLVSIITEMFFDWTQAAHGYDPSKDQTILIFKKKITKEKEFNRLLNNINTHQTINLKEVS